MQEKQLSKRLKTIASFVPEGARVLDVGSDHAYLPIYLTEQRQISFAIAGEVVEGPFLSAKKNIDDSGLSQQIQVRLANGLSAMTAEDKIDTIVIAGMGGRLITDILDGGIERLTAVSCLILQPNNREDELREWLMKHQFLIVEENIITEAGKIYEIIVAKAGQQFLSQKDIRFGPFLLEEKSPTFIKKWTKELEKLENTITLIPEEHVQERSTIFQKIKIIKEVLHVSK